MAAALGGAAPRAGAQAPHDPGDEDVVHEPPPPPVYVARLRAPGRAVIGLDFGIGLLDAVCGGCYAEGGISLDGFAGAQLAPRVALVVDAWSLFHLIATGNTGGPGLAAHAIATAGARVWLVPRLWLQAGLGGGGLLFSGGGGRDSGAELGPAAMFAVGGELGHKRFSGIDLSIRMGSSRVRAGSGGSDDADAGRSGDRVFVYSVAAVAGYHWN
ncbi:MAG TPA: hypothetical protein VKB80_14975 [Kofleriaceae bacterium]|nr:hypothetical protein [Kofleriaceae bacterium]